MNYNQYDKNQVGKIFTIKKRVCEFSKTIINIAIIIITIINIIIITIITIVITVLFIIARMIRFRKQFNYKMKK